MLYWGIAREMWVLKGKPENLLRPLSPQVGGGVGPGGNRETEVIIGMETLLRTALPETALGSPHKSFSSHMQPCHFRVTAFSITLNLEGVWLIPGVSLSLAGWYLQSPIEMVIAGLFPSIHRCSPVRTSSVPLKVPSSVPLCHGHHPLCVGASLKEHQFFPLGVSSVYLHPRGLYGPWARETPALRQRPWMGRCCFLHLLQQVEVFSLLSSWVSAGGAVLVWGCLPLPAICGGLTPGLELGFSFLLRGLLEGWWNLDLTWGFSGPGFLSPTELSHRRVRGAIAVTFSSS